MGAYLRRTSLKGNMSNKKLNTETPNYADGDSRQVGRIVRR